MAQRRSPLGPWMKVYVSCLDTKAHYSDEQFRALIETWMHAVRQPVRGLFPNRSALDRKVGRANVDFLIEQGDVELRDDGSVIPHRWDEYQSGVLSTGRGASPVESSPTVREQFPNGSLTYARDAGLPSTLSSSSETTNEEETTAVDARENAFDSDDPIDAFYLVTAQFPPEGGKLRSWISDVASKGPSRRDFGIVLRDEWAKNGMKVPDTLRATEARLSKMGERARQAEGAERRRRANRSVFETPFMREFREAVAANYDKPQNGNGLTAVGDVVASLNGGQGLPLTDVGTPGSTGPTRDPGRSSPSSPEAVRPSSSGPPELPDGPGATEGDDA
jgi:hypothetical protein